MKKEVNWIKHKQKDGLLPARPKKNHVASFPPHVCPRSDCSSKWVELPQAQHG